MIEEEKNWINKADYEALLRKYRFGPANDPMFEGDTCAYFMRAMASKRELESDGGVRISKLIGWGI